MGVRFRNRTEVRMGSPYRTCRLEITGGWKPRLDLRDWQDVKAESPDGRYVCLCRWSTRGNTPGFSLVVLDQQAQRVFRGRRISGACTSLRWSNGGFTWTSSLRRSGRFAPGHLAGGRETED